MATQMKYEEFCRINGVPRRKRLFKKTIHSTIVSRHYKVSKIFSMYEQLTERIDLSQTIDKKFTEKYIKDRGEFIDWRKNLMSRW